MNSVLGVVTEYNPFHYGHLYHLEHSKKITAAEFSVCIMSGQFMQRGEPALINKWWRTKMALHHGIDLVIELPVLYSLRSAEFFASGAISILNNMNIVDHLVFGSELGKIEPLENAANILLDEPMLYKQSLKDFLTQGLSFAQARQKALEACIKEFEAKDINQIKEALQQPNNILGIEYLKALKKQKSSIHPIPIKRIGSHFHDTALTNSIASATAIRKKLLEKQSPLTEIINFVPKATYDLLTQYQNDGFQFSNIERYLDLILYQLQTLSVSDLTKFFDVSEGLEYRIMHAAQHADTIDSLTSMIKTKRYTLTRIQRILLHLLLNIKKTDLEELEDCGGPQYIRVLGFNDKGRKLLQQMKKKSYLPIVTNVGQFMNQCTPMQQKMLQYDIRATNIYNLIQQPSKRKMNEDYYQAVIYFKSEHKISYP